MREALILVWVDGLSYSEAARICGCATGTMKSRVHRARAWLAQMLAIESADDFAVHPGLQSIVAGAARTHVQPRHSFE